MSCCVGYGTTELEATKSTIPTGMKMRPISTKLRITAFGVRIGCQALSLCCLKALSGSMSHEASTILRTAGSFYPVLFLLLLEDPLDSFHLRVAC